MASSQDEAQIFLDTQSTVKPYFLSVFSLLHPVAFGGTRTLNIQIKSLTL